MLFNLAQYLLTIAVFVSAVAGFFVVVSGGTKLLARGRAQDGAGAWRGLSVGFAAVLLMLAARLLLRARLNQRHPTAALPLAVTLLVWAFVPVAAMHTGFLYQRFALFLLPFYALLFRAPDVARRSVIRAGRSSRT